METAQRVLRTVAVHLPVEYPAAASPADTPQSSTFPATQINFNIRHSPPQTRSSNALDKINIGHPIVFFCARPQMLSTNPGVEQHTRKPQKAFCLQQYRFVCVHGIECIVKVLELVAKKLSMVFQC